MFPLSLWSILPSTNDLHLTAGGPWRTLEETARTGGFAVSTRRTRVYTLPHRLSPTRPFPVTGMLRHALVGDVSVLSPRVRRTLEVMVRALFAAGLLLLAGRAAVAQTNALDIVTAEAVFERVDEQIQKVPGLRFESVSFFAGYSSSGVPLNNVNTLTSQDAFNLGYDIDLGVSAQMSWRQEKRRDAFIVRYSPSAAFRARFPEFNQISHSVSGDWTHTFSERIRFGLSSGARFGSFGQIFFEPPTFRVVPNPPQTLEEIIAARQAGELTDEEVASILTGEPIIADPGGEEFSNSSSFTTSVAAQLDIRKSSRLTYFVDGGVAYSRFLTGREDRDELDERTFINGGRSLRIGSGADYKLTRRTSTSAQVSLGRGFNTIGINTFTINPSASITRSFGRLANWNASGTFGYGRIRALGDIPIAADGRRWLGTTTGGASVQYTRNQHAFTVSANRSVGDQLGLGSQSSDSINAGWSYAPLRAPWSLSVQGGYVRSDLIAFDSDLRGTRTALSYSRRITSATGVQATYSYFENRSGLIGVFNNFEQHRLQVGLVWGSLGRAGMPGIVF